MGNLSNDSPTPEASCLETASQLTGFELPTESGPSHGCLDKQADVPGTTVEVQRGLAIMESCLLSPLSGFSPV